MFLRRGLVVGAAAWIYYTGRPDFIMTCQANLTCTVTKVSIALAHLLIHRPFQFFYFRSRFNLLIPICAISCFEPFK